LVLDKGRSGQDLWYVRVPGQPKIRISETPGSLAFDTAYHSAMAGRKAKVQSKHLAPGSLGHICRLYYASIEFKSLDVSTRNWRQRSLDRISEIHLGLQVKTMQPKHIKFLRDELAAKPGAANNRLKALKAVFAWAVENDKVDSNPAAAVKRIRYRSAGHHSWTLEEVEAFEMKFAIGTKARLAMTLLLYTACRREDVVRFGPQNIKRGRLIYTQAKNEGRAPVAMDIPVHEDLAAVIDATLTGVKTFLVTDYGKPVTANGSGNKFRDWCNAAGLPHCSSHGLRKACAARLAERGCSAHEIMAITGHKSLEEVERYTEAARRRTLADSAMAKMKRD
jgi:integrase